MSRLKPNHEFFENLSDETLDAREALYLRLLHAMQDHPDSPVTLQLHARLCAVRAEQYAR
jgi:hypothetical protein